MQKIELNLTNQDIIEVNGEFFQYLSFKRISASKKGVGRKTVRSFRKISKERVKKFLNTKVCGKSQNNPSCQTSDDARWEGSF